MAFGSSENPDLQSKVDVHSKSLVSVVERQKDLENKIDVIDEKIELLDHNTIREIKKIAVSIKHLRDEIHDIKQDIEVVQEFQSKVKKQFKISATKDEVQKLERYIDLWNPMNFATKDEVLEMRDKIIEHLSDDIQKFLRNESKDKKDEEAKKASDQNSKNKKNKK